MQLIKPHERFLDCQMRGSRVQRIRYKLTLCATDQGFIPGTIFSPLSIVKNEIPEFRTGVIPEHHGCGWPQDQNNSWCRDGCWNIRFLKFNPKQLSDCVSHGDLILKCILK